MLAIIFAVLILCLLPPTLLDFTTPILLLNHCFLASLCAGWTLISIFAILKAYDCLSNGKFSAAIAHLDGVPPPANRQAKSSKVVFYGRTSSATSSASSGAVLTPGRAWDRIVAIRKLIFSQGPSFPQHQEMLCESVVTAPPGMAHMPGSFPDTSPQLPTAGTPLAEAVAVNLEAQNVQSAANSDSRTNPQANNVIQTRRPIAARTVRSRTPESPISVPARRGSALWTGGYRYLVNDTYNPSGGGSNMCSRVTNAHTINVYNLRTPTGTPEELDCSTPNAVQPLTTHTELRPGSLGTTTHGTAAGDRVPCASAVPLVTDHGPRGGSPKLYNRYQPRIKGAQGSAYPTIKTPSLSLRRVQRRDSCKLNPLEDRSPAAERVVLHQNIPGVNTEVLFSGEATVVEMADHQVLTADTQDPDLMDWEPLGCPVLLQNGAMTAQEVLLVQLVSNLSLGSPTARVTESHALAGLLDAPKQTTPVEVPTWPPRVASNQGISSVASRHPPGMAPPKTTHLALAQDLSVGWQHAEPGGKTLTTSTATIPAAVESLVGTSALTPGVVGEEIVKPPASSPVPRAPNPSPVSPGFKAASRSKSTGRATGHRFSTVSTLQRLTHQYRDDAAGILQALAKPEAAPIPTAVPALTAPAPSMVAPSVPAPSVPAPSVPQIVRAGAPAPPAAVPICTPCTSTPITTLPAAAVRAATPPRDATPPTEALKPGVSAAETCPRPAVVPALALPPANLAHAPQSPAPKAGKPAAIPARTALQLPAPTGASFPTPAKPPPTPASCGAPLQLPGCAAPPPPVPEANSVTSTTPGLHLPATAPLVLAPVGGPPAPTALPSTPTSPAALGPGRALVSPDSEIYFPLDLPDC